MKISLIRDLITVVEEYNQDIDLSQIGFPENFEDILNNNIM